MSKDLHQIDHIFKNGLEGKEDHPSPEVWQHIEKELDQKKSRRPFVYFPNSRKIAAILLVSLGSVALFAGGYFLRGLHMSNNEGNNPPAIERKAKGSGEEKSVPSQDLQPAQGESLPEAQSTPGSSAPGSSAPAGEASPATTPATSSVPGSAPSPRASVNEPTPEPRASANRTNTGSGSTSPFLRPTGAAPSATANSIADEQSASSNATKSAAAVATTSTSAAGPSRQSAYKSGAGSNTAKRGNTATVKNKATEAPVANATIDTDQPSIPSARSYETEPAPPAPENRSLPETEKQLPATSEVFKSNVPAATTAAAIPVINKKQGGPNLPRFSLTPVAALQFGSNRIKENNTHSNSAYVKADIVRTESQPSSLAGGILADLRISRNMTLQSGLVFTSRTIHIDPKNVIAEKNPDGKVRYRFDCSAGTYFIKKAQGYSRPGDTAMTKFSTNDLNYLNIPLGLTYHFGGSSWHIFLMGGTGLNLLTKQYLETGLKSGYYDEEDTKVSNLKSSYLNGSIGAGIIWSPFRKVSFSLNPQYQFAITPMNENMPIKAFPRIFNIQTGIQIRL